jgi:hypothetical protein
MSKDQPTTDEKQAFIKEFEAKAVEYDMTPLEYLVATGGDEIHDIMRRMIEAELSTVAPHQN